MAGSKRWFLYTADDNTQFAINLDNSNTVAINGTGKEYAKVTKYAIPQNLKPRSVRFKSDDGKRVLKAVVLTQGQYNTLINLKNPFVTQDPLDTVRNLTITGKTYPETFKQIPSVVDTGMTGLGPD